MGKSRQRGGGAPINSNNGATPQVSDLEIPDGFSSISVEPQENPGSKTTLQRDEEKIEREINDLYEKSFELEREKSFMWRQYEGSQRKLENLQNTMEQRGHRLTDEQRADLQYQINEAERMMKQDLGDYQTTQREYDEVNRRINTLETGFDTGDTTGWVTDHGSDHGL